MTVEEMCNRMSNGEYVKWTVYYGRREQERQMRED